MTTDRAIDIISTLLKGEWLQSEAAALITVHGLGYLPRPQTTEGSAARLSVSPFTVKTHAVRAMTKVGARDRAQLVTFTFRAGLYP